MQTEPDVNDLFERRRERVTVHHPPTREWTLDDLRQVMGVIALRGPAPSPRFLEEDESEVSSNGHTGE